jgi:hypothetical protein
VTRFLLLTLSLLVWILQGCSLLFVAKGKTGFVAVKSQEAPKAKSLSKEMDRADVIHHQVKDGETLSFLGYAYFGSVKEGAGQIAKANHLGIHSKLKPGRILKMVNPVYFPTNGELNDQLKAFEKSTVSGPDSKKTQSPILNSKDVKFDEKEIVKLARPKLNLAFAAGEKLVYEVKALSIIAGEATLEVDSPVTVAERPCYPLVARAKAAFPFSAIYPVKDVQTSYFDATDFITLKFENDVSEGSYRAQNLEKYDQVKHRLWRRHDNDDPEEVDIPPFAQDLISCFYYFRLLPIEVGEKYLIPTSSTGKNYNLVIAVVRREKVTIPLGTFDCYLVKPYVKHDTVFRNSGDIDLWVTADSRHVPVLIKSAIVIGSIEISLLQATLPEINGISDTLSTP